MAKNCDGNNKLETVMLLCQGSHVDIKFNDVNDLNLFLTGMGIDEIVIE